MKEVQEKVLDREKEKGTEGPKLDKVERERERETTLIERADEMEGEKKSKTGG